MPLSFRATKILRNAIHWPQINLATLNEGNIEYLEKTFKYLLDNHMQYTIDDMDLWLKNHFLGFHQDTKGHILDIAKEVLDAQQKTTQAQLTTRI